MAFDFLSNMWGGQANRANTSQNSFDYLLDNNLIGWNQGQGQYTLNSDFNQLSAEQQDNYMNALENNTAWTQQQTGPWWQQSNSWNTIGKGVGAVGGLANVYLGFEQLGIAKDQLALQKRVTNTQLANLAEDRARASTMRSTASTTA